MNMISTGAFLNEMDASNKQSTVAEKFAAVWEKKNAKAARAGGVSLMALSLAACGGSSSTTTTSTDTTTDTSTDTTTTVTGQSLTLVNAGTTTLDSVSGGAGDDTITAAAGRMNDGDTIDGGAGTDTLTATIDASADAYIDGVEVLNIKALGASASLNGVRITGAETVNVSGGGTLTIANAAKGIKYSVSDASTNLTVTQTGTDATTNETTVTLGAGKLGTITMGTQGGVDYETINLIIDGDGSATFTEAGTPTFADSGDSIKITGSGDYTLLINDGELGASATAGSQTAATIDASGHTGKLTIDLDALTTTNNVSAEKWTGVDAIRVETAAANTDVNIITKVASGTEIIVGEIEAVDNKLTITQSGTASDDTLTVTLNDEDKGGTIDLTKLTTDGFESLTINSTGTDSVSSTGVVTKVVNVIDTIAGLSTDPNLTITGDKKLTAGVESTFTNIDVTSTAGTDLTVASGGALDYDAGAGNDRLVLDSVADVTAADSLNAGGGTDTLAISQELGTDFSTAQRAVITNFEILEYTGAQNFADDTGVAVDLTKITGVNTLKMASDITTDDASSFTITAEDGFKLIAGGINDGNNTSASNFVLSIKDAANAGTNNTVYYDILDIGKADDASTGFTIDNVENLVISMTGDGDADDEDTMTIADIDGAQLTSLTVKSTNTGVSAANKLDGSDDLIITALETTTLSTLDASAMTGDFTITDTSAFAATGATIKGGSAVDTITAGAGADTITGGKGNDVLKGAAGNDNIDGGAGNDNIEGEGGADTLTGGAGDNTFVMDDGHSTEASMDIIKDFTAGATDADFDTIDFTLGANKTYNTIAKASAHSVTDHTTETETGTVSAYITNGVIKLTGTQTSTVDTLAEWIDIAEDTSVNGWSNNANAVDTVVVAFEFDGSTYVVMRDDGDTDGTIATESVIMLEGLTGVTAVSETEAANTIHVA